MPHAESLMDLIENQMGRKTGDEGREKVFVASEFLFHRALSWNILGKIKLKKKKGILYMNELFSMSYLHSWICVPANPNQKIPNPFHHVTKVPASSPVLHVRSPKYHHVPSEEHPPQLNRSSKGGGGISSH
ncbi:hypothetical protein CEXT_287261 [Caerostris extrusa]|uniref:Uncharacterized protein n=1 Tax=Caerostris extrusa TaxID=172846 RepID=A0AAV4XJ94_CAEEX|nr:hypothetical protein CEXT_287261 [Caerostris extrusa]